MGACVSCKTQQRRFAQSGQPIRRINVEPRVEIEREVELHRLEFIDLSLLISQKREPPKLIGLNNNLEFRLCCKTEFIPFNFYSKGHKSEKKDCLICWKKMCPCSNCSKKCSIISTCCNQTYHYKCFNKWMKIKNICPICKGLMFLIKEKSYNKKTKLKLRKYITCTYKLYNDHGEEVNIQNAFQLNDEYEDPALFPESDNEQVDNVPENNVSDSDVSENNIVNENEGVDIEHIRDLLALNDNYENGNVDNIEYEDATGGEESNIDDDDNDDNIRSYYSDILDYLPRRSSMNLDNSSTEYSVHSI